MNKEFDEILKKAKVLSKMENFKNEVNKRSFEIKITDISKSCKIDHELENLLKEEIRENYSTNLQLSFVLYFILYTMCRRQKYGNLITLTNDLGLKYEDYKISKHLEIMAYLESYSSPEILYKMIKESDKFIDENLTEFINNPGVLNVYCSLVCKYFEHRLEERKIKENNDILNKALTRINSAIKLEKEEKGDLEKVYNKFFLIKGRIQTLLTDYDDGEKNIQKAIELIPDSKDKEYVVNEYTQYLAKASIIKTYDLNESKVKELDKIKEDLEHTKVSNYKTITITTTLLGFLLGNINIFSKVENTYTLMMLMGGYSSLLLILLGIGLLCLTINLKERKKRMVFGDCVLIFVGLVIFVTLLLLINNRVTA